MNTSASKQFLNSLWALEHRQNCGLETYGGFLVRTAEPGEDFWTRTEYCFNKDDELTDIAYEVRTAWGWAFEMGGSVRKGAVRVDSKSFISTGTGQPIPKPESADDVRETLKPKLYLDARRLPFYSLLAK